MIGRWALHTPRGAPWRKHGILAFLERRERIVFLSLLAVGFRLLTFLALMIFKELEAFESRATSDQFVGKLGLVIISTATVHLLMGVLRFV